MIWSYSKAYGLTKRWDAKFGGARFRVEQDGQGATLTVSGCEGHAGEYWHESVELAKQAAKVIAAAHIGALAAELIEKPSLKPAGEPRHNILGRLIRYTSSWRTA